MGETVGIDKNGHDGLLRVERVDKLTKFRPRTQGILHRFASGLGDGFAHPARDTVAEILARRRRSTFRRHIDQTAFPLDYVAQPKCARRACDVADLPLRPELLALLAHPLADLAKEHADVHEGD